MLWEQRKSQREVVPPGELKMPSLSSQPGRHTVRTHHTHRLVSLSLLFASICGAFPSSPPSDDHQKLRPSSSSGLPTVENEGANNSPLACTFCPNNCPRASSSAMYPLRPLFSTITVRPTPTGRYGISPNFRPWRSVGQPGVV